MGPEETKKLLDHLNVKWKAKSCFACGENAWETHGYVHLAVDPMKRHVPDFMGFAAFGGILGGALHLPSAAVICRGCGVTVLVNLVVAGVVQLPAPAAEPAAEPGPGSASAATTAPVLEPLSEQALDVLRCVVEGRNPWLWSNRSEIGSDALSAILVDLGRRGLVRGEDHPSGDDTVATEAGRAVARGSQ